MRTRVLNNAHECRNALQKRNQATPPIQLHRQIVFILCVERLQGRKPVSIRGAQSRFDWEHDKEIVGYAWSRIRRRQHSHRMRTVSVVGGNCIVILDSLGVRTLVVSLETCLAAGPVVDSAAAVGDDARRPAGEAAVFNPYPLNAVLQEGNRVTNR